MTERRLIITRGDFSCSSFLPTCLSNWNENTYPLVLWDQHGTKGKLSLSRNYNLEQAKHFFEEAQNRLSITKAQRRKTDMLRNGQKETERKTELWV